MPSLILPSRFTQQPQLAAQVDAGNPLARGLASLILPSAGYPAFDMVSRQQLTAASAPTVAAGRGGMGLVTNGSSNYAWRTAPELSGQSVFTLTMVCQANGNGTDTRALGLGSSVSNNDIVAIGASTGNAQKIRLWGRTDSGANPTGTDSVSTPFDGGLHTIVLTVDIAGATANINLYVDGVLDTAYTSSMTASSFLIDRIALGCIVRSGNGSSAFWKGAIYLAAVHTRILTPAEGIALSANAFQLVKAPARRLWFAASTSTPTGTLASTLAGASLVASGVVVNQGAMVATLAGATLAAAGQVATPPSGSLTSTLDGATMAAAGAVTNTGTFASTLAGVTMAASGIVLNRGALASTLDGASMAAAGQVSPNASGVLASTLDGATLAAGGYVGTPPAGPQFFIRLPKNPRHALPH